jgi:enoyl-CoA hydratase/carnithine racemase
MGDLLYEVRDHAAYLTINRESRRNAISREMVGLFLEYLRQADEDKEVRVVCVTGAGDKAFCSGADLAVTLMGEGEDRLSGARQYAELMKRMARCGKPLVARVNGHCLAGGMGLMLSCDIVIAREDATFFTPEVNVGIFPMMVGTLLYRDVNRKKAVEMALTGRKISAPEAERIGLITRAVKTEHLDREVREVLNLLASKSPIGLRIGKEAFYRMSEMPFEEALDFLCESLGKAISTDDAREGMTAFVEKREPKFTGK